MKLKLTFLIGVLLIYTHSFAQECGTVATSEPQHFDGFETFSAAPPTPICVNVYFHIVRKNNGSGGFNPSNIESIVTILNDAFNPFGIYINDVGTGYINNSNYYDLDTNSFNNLINVNTVSNAVNFYLVNSYGPYAGQAEDIPSKKLVVVNSYALTSTSPHELGHSLNLYHTHQGTAPGTSGCSENINGSNCTTCGDYVCDTPADPGLNSNNVNQGCVYNGAGGYMPLTNNLMSYSPSNCRTNFTSGQGTRMRNALLSSQVLQSVISNQCYALTGPDVICDTSSYTYTIHHNIPLPTVTWQIPSEFQIISSGNNYVTVQANTIPTNGTTVVVKAILPLQTLEKETRLGKPEQPQVDGPLVVQPSYVAEYEVVNHTDGSEYEWTFPAGWEYNPYATGPGAGPWAWGKPLQAGQNGYISVTVTNDCGTDYVSFYVTAEQGGGGDPKSSIQNNFAIYPNPASQKIYIKQTASEKSSIKINHLKLFNKNGYLVKEKYFDNISELDVIGLIEDIYFLQIFTENNNIEIHRIIIKN